MSADKKSIPALSTRIIISHGDKGGVGKSFTSQAVIDYLKGKGDAVAVIEADTQNPDVERMFASALPCMLANLRTENGWMEVMDFVANHPGHSIVMNTPAGIGEHMKKDIATFAGFLKTLSTPTELELWWTMNLQHDSVNLMEKAFSSYGKHFARARVVCNLHFSLNDPSHFFLWNESPFRTKFEKTGGKTIHLPGLHLRVVQKLFVPDRVMPFSDAIDASLGEILNLTNSERHKLAEWHREVDMNLDAVFAEAVNG